MRFGPSVHPDPARRASATEPASVDERDVALQTALPQADFAGSNADNFGGFPTNFLHPGPTPGCLEHVPYGTIHVTVGARRSGWGVSPLGPWTRSSDCTTPISTASGRSGAHVIRAITPPSLKWLSRTAFAFYDATPQIVILRCADVVGTRSWTIA